MDTKLNEKIEAQIFLGCQVTSDLRAALEHNVSWKAAQIVKQSAPSPSALSIIPFRGKEYLGHFVNESNATIANLTSMKEAIEEKICSYCPNFEVSKLNYIIFPQLFIS